ncbi:unnamed protein product [Lathyrus sativus]|nr:unnamed protein product [Lathyrus sativus]
MVSELLRNRNTLSPFRVYVAFDNVCRKLDGD